MRQEEAPFVQKPVSGPLLRLRAVGTPGTPGAIYTQTGPEPFSRHACTREAATAWTGAVREKHATLQGSPPSVNEQLFPCMKKAPKLRDSVLGR